MIDLTQLPAGLPVPPDDGAADHLAGRSMPPVELSSTAGATIRLDALGGGRTVLYIYPLTGRPDRDLPAGWDEIPGARGCSTEACSFRDHHRELMTSGAARVFGLSSQDVDYQREVVQRLNLPFEMLADPTFDLAEALDLPTFSTDGTKYFKRLTLVVNEGVIEHVFYPIFPPNDHAQHVLTWLTANP